MTEARRGPSGRAGGGLGGEVRLIVHQARFEQLTFWRNPASAFFTFAFPLMFLVIFASLNTGTTIDFFGGLNYNQYFIPGIIAYGVIAACFMNVALKLAIRRDSGLLKRERGTPLRARDFLAGLLLNQLLVAILLVVLTALFGVLFYGVTFPGHYVALLVALVVGAATFCACGVAVAAMVPNADAAPAVINLVMFPILFLSGVFFPVRPGSTISHIASVFPVRPLVQTIFAAFDPRLPHGPGNGFAWGDIGIMAIWFVVASMFAVRHFRWEPRR
ncbi:MULTISPECIES: ABC transporter permease [unclassified Frankia]|uniref:ABC transporter permease n=1 Tax=unclassified Frankia TaxID=2632575 RepID=UPI001EF49DA9|nr:MULTISPECIES: ABC transporter permease [unclassified Frankia]